MTNFIRELPGKKYIERLRECRTVIVPTGACEIYGPQLPMGSDHIVATKIADLVAAKTGALVAPTIECGESSALASFPCTFAMPRRLLEDWLDFVVGKVISDGARNILFITGHAGNVDTVNLIVKKYLQTTDVNFAQVDWWRFAGANSGDVLTHKGAMAHGHASECGTSVMLYLRPELVDMAELTKIEPAQPGEWGDLITYARMTDRTPNGTIGDATPASREKGEKIVNACVDRIVAFMRAKFGA